MSRHLRHRCKIANSDEGMEKLLDYTIARQLAEIKQEHDKETARQTAKIDELTIMMKHLACQITLMPAQAMQHFAKPLEYLQRPGDKKQNSYKY